MEDHPNVRLVTGAYERLYEHGDAKAFFGAFSRELRFHFLRGAPSIVRTYESRQDWIEGMLTPLLTVTGGTFAPRPQWVRAAGEDLVVAHMQVTMTLDGEAREGAAALVYRIADGRIAEAWDVPSTPTDATLMDDLEAALAARV